MKIICLSAVLMLFTFCVGTSISEGIKLYLSYLNVQNEITVVPKFMIGKTWQDDEQSCGKPQKSFFSDELVIIDNPLCSYSADLHEIPTVTYSELSQNPKLYDRKIIRVKGRYFIENDDPQLWNSRLFLMSDDGINSIPIEFNSTWNFDITTKLYNFIRSNAPNTNTVEVSLIIEFLNVSYNTDAMKTFRMIILHVEEMNAYMPICNRPLIQLEEPKSKNKSEGLSFSFSH